MKNRYIFPAIFEEEEGSYNISFPDLKGAFTFGKNLEDGLYMAKDCLETYLQDMEKIPEPNFNIQSKLKKGKFLVLIEADLLEFKKKYDNKLIKKTLTIPNWINEEGKKAKINFSKLLTKALEKELNL